MLTDSTPAGAGLDPDKLQAAFSLVAAWVEDGTVPGTVALVARRGRIAGAWVGGNLSHEPGDWPITVNTPFPVASITKVVTALALLRQIDEGKVELDAPVPTILPEWRVPGSERITLRLLLSHPSGLPEDLPRGALNYEDRNPLNTIIEAFMRVEPMCAPDERLIYSNIGYGIIGTVLERLSGRSFRETVWRSVLGPLWMNDTWFGSPPTGRLGTVAVVAGTDRPGTDLEPYNSMYWRGLGHPWGGMFSTAADLAKLAQLFLDNGKPLLPVGTALSAIRNWTNGLPGGFSTWPTFPTGDWGLGWEVKGSRGKHWTGAKTSHTTFGHTGGSGVMMWADPMRDLICVALANRTISNYWPIAHPHRRWPAFSEAVVEAIG